jgi:hypothetical protein
MEQPGHQVKQDALFPAELKLGFSRGPRGIRIDGR